MIERGMRRRQLQARSSSSVLLLLIFSPIFMRRNEENLLRHTPSPSSLVALLQHRFVISPLLENKVE